MYLKVMSTKSKVASSMPEVRDRARSTSSFVGT
jgi:hypothetical protein